MNIQDFKKALPILLNNNIVPFVWGNQGIGKTQTVGQVAKQLGVGFVHLHLATQEVGDLVGLLVNNGDGTVSHARPEWFPTEGQGIIFLDELNRAHPDVIQAMFSFITSKSIHRHVLPTGWKIVAAGNFQGGDRFNVTDTSDAAWMSRFCHLTLSPTVVEFTTYAASKDLDTVSNFIAEHNACLEMRASADEAIHVTPDRRSWIEMVGPLENESMDENIRFELYSGCIGQIAATSFFAWKKTAERSIKLKDIMKDYAKVRSRVKDAHKEGKDTRFDLLTAPIDELTHLVSTNTAFLTADGVENLKQYFLDLPLELLSKVLKKLGGLTFDHKELLLNDPVFAKKLMKNKAAA